MTMRILCTSLAIGWLAGFALFAHDTHGKSHAPASAKALKSPLSPAQAKPELGKEAYDQACAACHGEDGKANVPAAAKMKPKPSNLASKHLAMLKDGEIYWVITNGIGKSMPAMKDQLQETERWQIVNYVRALAKNAAGHSHQ